MDLSNLRPADGAKHNDNFRRGRGHGSGMARLPARDTRARRLAQAAQGLDLKAVRCRYTEESPRGALQTGIPKRSLVSM